MNHFSRKLCVALVVVVLGINLILSGADAADHCAGSACLHCNGMIISVNEPAARFGLDGQGCDVSFGHTPCNLNKNPKPNAPAVILSSTHAYRQETGLYFAFASYKPSLFLNIGGNHNAGRFQIRSDIIPIYLQNLSFLC